MGTATNSPPVMAVEKKHLACGELGGCTRFFSTLLLPRATIRLQIGAG